MSELPVLAAKTNSGQEYLADSSALGPGAQRVKDGK